MVVSEVWQHYNRTEGKAKCKYCNREITTKGGQTTGAWGHLKAMHSDKLKKAKQKEEPKMNLLEMWGTQVCA